TDNAAFAASDGIWLRFQIEIEQRMCHSLSFTFVFCLVFKGLFVSAARFGDFYRVPQRYVEVNKFFIEITALLLPGRCVVSDK
ncbi:hypothetical protein, partial [Alkalicoccus urumqiensis]